MWCSVVFGRTYVRTYVRTHTLGVMECRICLGSDPAPIPTGCACRGSMGHAHVACTAQCVVGSKGWRICTLCDQFFTGKMRFDLAVARVKKACTLPEGDEERQCAAVTFAEVLAREERYTEAKDILESVLRHEEMIYPPYHIEIVRTQSHLMNVLEKMGDLAAAETLGWEVYGGTRRALGPDDIETIRIYVFLSSVLYRQARYADAESLLRHGLPKLQLALGGDHVEYMLGRTLLARCLVRQGKITEGKDIQEHAHSVFVRVLGTEHPATQLCVDALKDIHDFEF